MAYRLRLMPYCGSMSTTLERGDLGEVRQAAGREIRRHREAYGYPVTILVRGQEWELEGDPDGESMVSDREGILAIQRACDECGRKIDDGPPIGRIDESCLCDGCAERLEAMADLLDDLEFCGHCGAVLTGDEVDYCVPCQAMINGEEEDDE